MTSILIGMVSMAKTLATIAQNTGVSQATISRVINGKPGVSESTRNTVLDAMDAAGIPRNKFVRPNSRFVAIVTPDLSNPIFPEFVTRLNTLLQHAGYQTQLCTYKLGGVTEADYLTSLGTQEPAGVIFLAGQYDTKDSALEMYKILSEHKIPAAFLNGTVRNMDGLYVGTNDQRSTEMALNHLANLGHERIGLLLGDLRHYPSIIKHKAALKFFKSHGLEHSEELTQWTTYGLESGQMAATKLLEKGVTAIFCASDQLALGAIKAAHNLDLDVPHDISVVGYDDSMTMSYISPALTTIRQPIGNISETIVSGLQRMMEDYTQMAKRELFMFEPELLARDSTAICRKS